MYIRRIYMIGALIILAGIFLYFYQRNESPESITVLPADEVVVIRTPGGFLEVSTLTKNEEYSWKTKWDCPVNLCNILGETVSEIRVDAHYTYRVPLAKTWKLTFRGEYFELKVPRVEPKIPVAIELAKMKIKAEGGWFSPDKLINQQSLLNKLGPILEERSKLPSYINLQREFSAKTVAEFARKWMAEQGGSKAIADYPIKVFFEGEVY